MAASILALALLMVVSPFIARFLKFRLRLRCRKDVRPM
jgi:hypothetical protein